MQATDKEKKTPGFIVWIIRALAVVMTAVSIVFLVLCSGMVTTMDALGADYNMVDEPRIVYEERQMKQLDTAIKEFKTKATALRIKEFIATNNYLEDIDPEDPSKGQRWALDPQLDSQVLLNNLTKKAILVETGLTFSKASEYNALMTAIKGGGALSADAQALKDFLDENSLPYNLVYATTFMQSVREVVFGDKIPSKDNLTVYIDDYTKKAITAEATTTFRSALEAAGFGDTLSSTKINDYNDKKADLGYTGYEQTEFHKLALELIRYNVLVKDVVKHKGETDDLADKIAAVEETFGVDANYDAIQQLAAEIEADLAAFKATPQNVSVLEEIIADMTAQKEALTVCATNLQAELDSNLASQGEARATHKVYLWLWVIFEILALLSTSALLAMPEVLGGNEKVSRISGAVLFVAVAVQLILILHLGIM